VSEALRSRISWLSRHTIRADSTDKNGEQAALTGNGPTYLAPDIT
jgi:hypothetical protein